ncbi:FAD-dependent oxidoreductase [Streptomyces armeniacus]|uniref:FAD-dependent oxidoreductase n=1 Tax=Streptomyces armeniacus TaxID=83291 RepID=UPI001FE9CA84|nr:FAD-dependent oxidoreductase [Streptomyces armeniacus]
MLTSSARTRRTNTSDADVVIVGAGLAGLAAAHHLTSAGLAVVVLEAQSHVGGRMATDHVDGFRLDRGAGLLCSDWPELAGLPGLGLGSALALRPFTPGALMRTGDRCLPVGDLRAGTGRHARAVRQGREGRQGRVPYPYSYAYQMRSTKQALSAARSFGGGRGLGRTARTTRTTMSDALDLARLRAGFARLANTPAERLRARAELPAGEALSARGLPTRTADTLVGPLLAALLCDPELTTSSRVADLALRSFVRSGLCLPAGGASTLPELLAAGLPKGTVRRGVRATSVAANAVNTDGHGVLGCRAALIATGARDAARLLPGLRVPDFHPVTVLHHAAQEPPMTAPALVVDADRHGPVSHTWVTSAVDPSRARPDRTLISSVVLGPAAADPVGPLDKAARTQLAELYGVPTDRWELLRSHHDPRAVPAMPTPHDGRRPVRVLCGLYVCGDHRDTSSTQGALSSARRAAVEVLRDFGLRTAGVGERELLAVA